MSDFERRLTDELAMLDRKALRRQRRTRGSTRFPQIDIDGRRLINFAANDYLGLAADPRLAEALARGAKRWGVGAGAAHLLSGHTRAHEAFEKALADFLGCEAALLFSTGYMANLGLIGALAGRGDTVVEDKLNHASLIDGATLARAKLLRYRHGDAEAAATRLGGAQGRKLLVTDGVFSMDGDVAPLKELAAVAKQSDALLMVDDAHGFGVLGPQGRGSPEAAGLTQDELAARVVTLGKALGVFGAAVAGSRALIETLVQRARPWVFTTALPPALAEAMTTALGIVRDEPWRRERLREHVARFRAVAQEAGWHLAESSTPIQPIIVGSSERALAVSEQLFEQGYYLPAVRPPTVPEGTARLRVTFSAGHDATQVEGLLAALKGTLGEHG